MGPATRNSIAEAFTACLPHLWNGKSDMRFLEKTAHICFALCRTKHPAYYLATSVITHRLGNSSTVQHWLFMQGIPVEAMTHPRLQAHRKAWVKQLIKEFSQ